MTHYKSTTFNVQIPNLEGDGIAETIPLEVQVYLDPETGEEVLTPEAMELIEKTQARHMGLMSPEEIKTLRERLELTQQEMCELLQIGDKSYTRWETGRGRPSRSINLLLCALRDGRLDVSYLRSLRAPSHDWAALIKSSEAQANVGWEHIEKIIFARDSVTSCALQTRLFGDRPEMSSQFLRFIMQHGVNTEETVTTPRLTAARRHYQFHPEEEEAVTRAA